MYTMLNAFGFAMSSPPKASRVRSKNHFDPPMKLSEPKNPGDIGFPQFGQFGIGRSALEPERGGSKMADRTR
jgi:hypothetical protein